MQQESSLWGNHAYTSGQQAEHHKFQTKKLQRTPALGCAPKPEASASPSSLLHLQLPSPFSPLLQPLFPFPSLSPPLFLSLAPFPPNLLFSRLASPVPASVSLVGAPASHPPLLLHLHLPPLPLSVVSSPLFSPFQAAPVFPPEPGLLRMACLSAAMAGCPLRTCTCTYTHTHTHSCMQCTHQLKAQKVGQHML